MNRTIFTFVVATVTAAYVAYASGYGENVVTAVFAITLLTSACMSRVFVRD